MSVFFKHQTIQNGRVEPIHGPGECPVCNVYHEKLRQFNEAMEFLQAYENAATDNIYMVELSSPYEPHSMWQQTAPEAPSETLND